MPLNPVDRINISIHFQGNGDWRQSVQLHGG